MFFLEKYRPKTFNDFLFNKEILEKLMFIASNEDIPHMIFCGPNCSGKETLIKYLLEVLFDADASDTHRVKYKIQCSSAKKEIFVNQSNYHIIFEPTKTNYDKYILESIVSQYATNDSFKIFKKNRKFKVLIINNAENLASKCQYILRRNMEMYAASLRIFIVTNDLSKIIDPLRSRCQIFCFSLPTRSNICNVLTNIAIRENIDLDAKDYEYILANCDDNLSKAVWMLDCKRLESPDRINLDTVYETLVDLIVNVSKHADIVKTFDVNIRTNIYTALITNIRGSEVTVSIMKKVIDKIDDEEVICKIIKYASDAEYNLIDGRRDIMHIDYFVMFVMRELFDYDSKHAPKISIKPTTKLTKKTIVKKPAKKNTRPISGSGSKTSSNKTKK